MKAKVKELLLEEVSKREEVEDKLRKSEKKVSELLEQMASTQIRRDHEMANERQ
jgi:hypothetical protein